MQRGSAYKERERNLAQEEKGKAARRRAMLSPLIEGGAMGLNPQQIDADLKELDG